MADKLPLHNKAGLMVWDGTAWVNAAADATGKLEVVSSGGGGGGAVTIADGDDVALGATTDAAVTGDNTGTASAKLRGFNKVWADVWDSVNHWLKVSIQGTVNVVWGAASTSTLSNVSASASNVTLLAANASRKGAVFFNDSTSAVYIKLGTTASTSSFTYKVQAYQTVELPPPIYQGQVDAIWDSATGAARITEIT